MGIFGSLFGKKASSSGKSYNDAAKWVNSTYQPLAATGSGAINTLSGELGGGFDSYKDHSGYNFGLNEGLDGITGNAASRGLLNSGSTGKAYERYGADYFGNQYYNNYLGQLGNLAQLGLGAGNLVVGANQRSEQESHPQGTSGILGKIGQAAGTIGKIASIFSDRRLKADITKIGEAPDGLGLYRYRYKGEKEMREGVMADEVAELRPWALGPLVGGYATVRYDLLEG